MILRVFSKGATTSLSDGIVVSCVETIGADWKQMETTLTSPHRDLCSPNCTGIQPFQSKNCLSFNDLWTSNRWHHCFWLPIDQSLSFSLFACRCVCIFIILKSLFFIPSLIIFTAPLELGPNSAKCNYSIRADKYMLLSTCKNLTEIRYSPVFRCWSDQGHWLRERCPTGLVPWDNDPVADWNRK